MHEGIVTVAAYGSTYGNQVKIYKYGGPLTSLYAHLSRIDVRAGQAVMPGQIIGISGNTGHSTRPHLHVGIKIDGIETPCKNWIDPLLYLAGGVRLGNKLSYHVQRHDAPGWLREQVRRSGAWLIKVMQPDKGPATPFGDVTYLGRLYWDNEPDKELIWQGIAGADAWWAMAWPRIQAAPWVRIWEGPNEPAIDTPERAWQFVAFELRRIQLLHAHGLLAASGCFSTGKLFLSLWV